MVKLLSAIVAFVFLLAASGHGQSFVIQPAQIEIAVAPGFNHSEIQVPITGTPPGFDFDTLTSVSDANWVASSVNSLTGSVVLTFNTAALLNATNTATITVTGSGTTDTFFVKASVAPLNIVRFEDDPVRSRTYGLHQNGLNQAAVVAINPLDGTPIGCVSVGKKATDIAVSKNGAELIAINTVDKTITAIDLVNLRVTETISLPQYDNWGVNDTTGDVGYGPNGVIYYTDGAWAPALRVLNRATGQVLQSVLDNTYGFGDFALSPDGKFLFGWVQYGWNAGLANSYIVKYSVATNGTLTFAERTSSTYPTGLSRDPLDTPVLIDAASNYVFIKQMAVNPSSVADTKRSFPKPIYSITPGGEIAATDSGIFQTSTGINIANLPVTTAIQTITSDYARLVYFNKTARTIGTVDLMSVVGPAILGRNLSPAHNSITQAPSALQWSPLPGVDTYRVYLGTSETEVLNANTSSGTYLGEVAGATIPLNNNLTPGTKYYWRVDAVTTSEVTKGAVYSFTVSLIGVDRSSIETATVQGHNSHRIPIQLTSSQVRTWQATADEAWVKFDSTSGTTQEPLGVVLDASDLAKGIHTATISVSTNGQDPFTIPVTLEVEPLAVTVMESDRTSARVYAISEDTTRVGGSRAYLLEIDSEAKAINRVVPVGTSATDIAVHNLDGRVYVTNWRPGSLLALDLVTLQQVRAYGFSPFGAPGYDNDVYRIAAGAKGRLLVEEQDQWVDIAIFDTNSGVKLSKTNVREGGGEFGPGGRFYYHGENNSSGAEIRKFDVVGDVFTPVANRRVESATYYGSRTVVVSENGEKVFWNGGVMSKDLVVQWLIGKEIYSTTPDGKYAFGSDQIYDTELRQAVLGMPVSTKVSSYNATSGRLVVQVGGSIRFYTLGASDLLPTPVLSVKTTTGTTVQLQWTDESLETGFTLQRRIAGATSWDDVPANLGANVTTYTVPNLSGSTTYEFRIKADSSVTSSGWSEIVEATTLEAPPQSPVVATTSASSVSTASAVLNGTVNPNGRPTTYYFEYGLTTEYGNVTTSVSVGQGTTVQYVQRTITGLSPGTTYQFRVVAVNADGTSYGVNRSFTTASPQPAVTTNLASNITPVSATLNGTVYPNGIPTTFRFEYGLTSLYGNTTADQSAGSGSGSISYSRDITGLMPNTLYHFRIVATHANGTVYGADRTFITGTQSAAPSVATIDASEITRTSARLNGMVNPNALTTTAYVEYGVDSTYGRVTDSFVLPGGASITGLGFEVNDLLPGTTYVYRMVASNAQGVTHGTERSFRTATGELTAVNDSCFTSGRHPVNVDVLANDSGAPREVLTVLSVSQGSAGSVKIESDGTITYTPSVPFEGVDTFTYTVSDGAGNSASATVVVRETNAACAGTYHALIGTSSTRYELAGDLLVKVSRKGTFTAVLKFAGATRRLKGRLDQEGKALLPLPGSGQKGNELSITIDPGSQKLSGSVSVGGQFVSLEAHRVGTDGLINSSLEEGRYSLLLPSAEVENEAQGHGFGTMRVSAAGSVTISGRMGDGRRFSTSAHIGNDSRFPLYSAGKNAGVPSSLQGWVQFRYITGISDCDATLGYAIAGEEETKSVELLGSRYIVPAPGSMVLEWQDTANGRLNLVGVDGGRDVTSLGVKLSKTHSFTSSPAATFKAKVNPKTGTFKGKFSPSGKKAMPVQGIVFQRQNMAAGFIKTRDGARPLTLDATEEQKASPDASSEEGASMDGPAGEMPGSVGAEKVGVGVIIGL